MNREALLGGIAISLLAGCAPEAAKIQSQYVSPEIYANYDCRQIAGEFNRLSRRAEELGAVVDKQASDDAAQAFVGIVIFWPALFFLEGGETQQTQEYARIKGELETLEKVSVERGCGTDIRQLAKMDPSEIPATTHPQKLEALKMLYRDGAITEEEYLKRRKELTEAQAKEELAAIERQKANAAAKAAAAAAAPGPQKKKVVILPVGRGVWATAGTTRQAEENDILERVRFFVERQDTLEIIYSTDDPRFPEHAIEFKRSSLWKGVATKKPVETLVYATAKDLDADLALTFFWDAGNAGQTTITVYLFDIEKERKYERGAQKFGVRFVDELLEHVFRTPLAEIARGS